MMFHKSMLAISFGLVLVQLSTAAKHCGTFTFKCTEKNAPACNNACFDFYCRNNKGPLKKANRDQNDANKYDNGCSYGSKGKSICRYPLFAKMFDFPKKLEQPSCDEWPPKSVVRDPSHTSSLRCMNVSENSAGGEELNKFYTARSYQGKTCHRQLVAGDTFDLSFDYDPNLEGIPYCKGKGAAETCDQDGFQFLLTKKPGEKGLLNTPYVYDSNSRYALNDIADGHQSERDIKMCMASLFRENAGGKIQYKLQIGIQQDNGQKPRHIGRSETFDNTKNTISVSAEETGLDHGLSATPADPGQVDSVVVFKYGNLEWNNNDKVDLGGDDDPHDMEPWCYFNGKIGKIYSNKCVFPCTGLA